MPTPESFVYRHKNLGPLHDLLLRACPPDKTGKQSLSVLSDLMGVTPWGILCWVHKGRIPPARVNWLVEHSDGRVTREDFLPYVFAK